MPAGDDGGRRLRVLALHGRRQDAEIFQQRAKKLIKRLEPIVDFCFVDAPHCLELEEGQEIPMRSWWLYDGAASTDPQEQRKVIARDWEASLAEVTSAWERHGPFDGVLGFSNGAAASVILAACHRVQPLSSLRFAVVASGYIPEPWEELRAACGVGPGDHSLIQLQSLHLIGADDRLVDPSESTKAAKLFSQPQVYRHSSGHAVPQKGPDIQVIVDFLQDQLEELPAKADKALPSATEDEANGNQEVAEQVTEELEALQAIYMEEYDPSSTSSCLFTIHLRTPDSADLLEGEGPPSRLFRLVFMLPAGYPGVAPSVQAVGPLSSRDPRRSRFESMLKLAAEERLGAAMIYEIVEEARAWIDAELPADIGMTRGGNGDSSKSDHLLLLESKENGAQDQATTGSCESHSELTSQRYSTWCLEEEINMEAVRRAIATAADCYELPEGRIGPQQSQPGGGSHVDEEGDNGSGRWDYTIGLVGKPSAGKSTFFNAATDPDEESEEARVAAFPFTTIDPNVGRGYFATPCPCGRVGVAQEDCGAIGGHVEFGSTACCWHSTLAAPDLLPSEGADIAAQQCWRHATVALKDVAGLVPGAYQGRGRGNAFLNDLCDADVLLHIIDASGSTDSEGAATAAGEGSNPLDEIRWLREELHCWIFNNVKAKWSTVLRRPQRLPVLFTGYRSSHGLIAAVHSKCGVDVHSMPSLESVKQWGEDEVHLLVAHFLRIRFPTLLVLNKVDVAGAEDRVRLVRETLPNQPAVAVSADSEWWLNKARRTGEVSYLSGAASFTSLKASNDPRMAVKAAQVQSVMERYGGTGVQAALSAVVALRPPAIAYPVADLVACTAYAQLPISMCATRAAVFGSKMDAKARAVDNANGRQRVLRDCVLLKPSSTVGALYETLRKPPFCLLEGEYVRAECRTGPGAHRLVKKDEPVSCENQVVRIMCNKKKGFGSSAKNPETAAARRRRTQEDDMSGGLDLRDAAYIYVQRPVLIRERGGPLYP